MSNCRCVVVTVACSFGLACSHTVGCGCRAEEMTMARKAVVLLSGGLDSTTVLAKAIDEGYEVYAVSFDYVQRHRVELEAARRVAAAYGVARHQVCKIDL